jgi:hypothetical protein
MEDRKEADLPAAAGSPPAVEGLFIDLGAQGPDDVALLKDGTGAMAAEIHAALDRWRDSLAVDTASDIVPVVLLYRKRNQRL